MWSKRTERIDAEAAPEIAEYERLLGRTLTSAERAGVVKTAVLKRRARKQHPELSALHATWGLDPVHTRAVQQLDACRAEREQLRAHRNALHSAVQPTREQLPRWAYRRRRALADTLAGGQQRLRETEPTIATLDAEVDRLTRQLAHHTRQQQASDLAAERLVRPGAWNPTQSGQPTRPGAAQLDAHELVSTLVRREPYRGPEPDRADGLHR